MYARLLWDPDLDMEALYEDFLHKYFGGGWQYIREYLRFTAQEASHRMWKADTFRGEFWPLRISTGLRMNANKRLFEDFYELLGDDKGDFYALKIYLLFPKMWTWLQLGRSSEGNVSSFLELMWRTIF